MRTSTICWHNASTGETQLWLMDGARVANRETVLGQDGKPALVGLPFSIVAAWTLDSELGERFCDFFDPPGSPTIGPLAYAFNDSPLTSNQQRTSQVIWTANGSLPGAGASGPGGQPNPGPIKPMVALGFNIWTAATAPTPGAAPLLANIDGATTGQTPNVTVGVLPPQSFPSSTTLGSTLFARQPTIALTTGTTWESQASASPPGLPANRPSLLAVVTHEIGHALGLAHSTNPSSIMYPINTKFPETLSPEDVAAIRALYGWTPPVPVEGIGSAAAPALCACGATLVMAWRGAGADDQIWTARSADGIDWTPQHAIPGSTSADGPALAWDGHTLWLAHRGSDDDGLYWATSTDFGDHWSSIANVPNTGSAVGPGLTIFNGVPFLAWRGVADDDGLYWAAWTPGNAPPWSAQASIPDVGSLDTPTVCVDPNKLLRILWRGGINDDALYTSAGTPIVGSGGLLFEPQQLVQSIVAGNGAAGNTQTHTAASQNGPDSVVQGGRLLLAWRGVPNDDDSIYFTQGAPGGVGQQPVQWSSQASVPGSGSLTRPTIAAMNGRIHLAWRGAGEDDAIYAVVN
jgi:Matrixin